MSVKEQADAPVSTPFSWCDGEETRMKKYLE